MIGKKIALGALLGLTAQVACAAPPTLCKRGEVTYFSCQLKGARVMSVCGSGAVEPSEPSAHRASWLQYRIGTLKALELVFPKRREDSVSRFEWESRRRAGVRINALDFKIASVAYSVEESYSEMTKEGFTGVKVIVGSKETGFPCQDDATLDSEFDMITRELDPFAT
jgi:hypothetical protein